MAYVIGFFVGVAAAAVFVSWRLGKVAVW
jgi:hypothetical protein